MRTYVLNGKNKYWSLYKKLRGDILEGRLKKGERLPSKRALADSLNVSVVTVQSAYEQLLAEGYVYSKERSGYFVSDVNVEFYGERGYAPVVASQEKKYALDFVKGTASSLFPFSTWVKLMRAVLSDCGEHLLERVPCDGDGELKNAVAGYLYRARGIDVDPRYVVIGAGAEYLYGVIVQLLGRDKLFAVENPGYGKIAKTYILNGAKCGYIPVTDGGVDCGRVEESCADVLHISPSHQFPTGAVTPASSRARLISWANAGGRYVVEDDYDSEFRRSGKPLQSMFSLCPDRVIYINTFSKSLAPSMRMGYMVLPPALYEKYLRLFSHSANVVPLFEQKTLAKMLDGGYFERHINRLKNYYRTVRQAILDKAEEIGGCTVKDTGSGLHLLVSFKGADDGYIKSQAAQRGINLRCVSDYLLKPLEGAQGWAVINYTGVTPQAVSEIKI